MDKNLYGVQLAALILDAKWAMFDQSATENSLNQPGSKRV